MRGARGFTLVEILTAMFILILGICGILSIIMRSSQMGSAAADRNNASILIPEAIADIERMHLVPLNGSFLVQNPTLLGHEGELMDTVALGETGNENPFIPVIIPNPVLSKTATCSLGALAYTPLTPQWVSSKTYKANDVVMYNNLCYSATQETTGAIPVQFPTVGSSPYWAWVPRNLTYWPLSPDFGRTMGQFPQTVGDPHNNLLNDPLHTNSATYRALYKLEPHPEWVPDPYNRTVTREIADSPYVGVYVLTITMYRDLEPAKKCTVSDKKLQQVCDPVVHFLHDKKVRP